MSWREASSGWLCLTYPGKPEGEKVGSEFGQLLWQYAEVAEASNTREKADKG